MARRAKPWKRGSDGKWMCWMNGKQVVLGDTETEAWARLQDLITGVVKQALPTTAVKAGTVEELIRYYRAINGEHENWNEYRAAMVSDRRLVVRFLPENTYGSLRG